MWCVLLASSASSATVGIGGSSVHGGVGGCGKQLTVRSYGGFELGAIMGVGWCAWVCACVARGKGAESGCFRAAQTASITRAWRQNQPARRSELKMSDRWQGGLGADTGGVKTQGA